MLLGKRRGELHAVAHGKRALRLPIDADPLEATRVVGDGGAVLPRHRDRVRGDVGRRDARVLAGVEAIRRAAAGVAHDVAGDVPAGPLSIGASQVLTGHEHPRALLVAGDVPGRLQRPVNRRIQVLPRLVVRAGRCDAAAA